MAGKSLSEIMGHKKVAKCWKDDKSCLYYSCGFCRAYSNEQYWLLDLNGCLKHLID